MEIRGIHNACSKVEYQSDGEKLSDDTPML